MAGFPGCFAKLAWFLNTKARQQTIPSTKQGALDMKKLLFLMLLGSAGFASAAEFSGNVAYTTDYRFRGISQVDRSQAIQGGFDIEFGEGFYIGTWASNVGAWSGATIEVDYYAGYAMDLSDNLGVDVGVLYYGYPEDDADPDLDYIEFYGSLAFQDFTLGLNFSNDYFAGTDAFWYLYGDYSFGLADNISLDLHLGLNLFKDAAAGAAFFGVDEEVAEDSYLDYSIGLSTSGAGLDWTLAFIGADLSKDDCFGGSKLCKDSLVVSVSKSL